MSEQSFSEDYEQTGVDYNYEDYCNQKEILFSQWVGRSDQSSLHNLKKRRIQRLYEEAQEIFRCVRETHELSREQRGKLNRCRGILHSLKAASKDDQYFHNLRINTIQQIHRLLKMFLSECKVKKIQQTTGLITAKIIEQCDRANQLINSIGNQYNSQVDYEWEILVIKSHLERFPEIQNIEIQRKAEQALEDLKRASDQKQKYNKQELLHKEMINEDQFCRICYQHPRSYATVPCGHLIYCEKCKDHVRNTCMMCRQPVTSLIRIFY